MWRGVEGSETRKFGGGSGSCSLFFYPPVQIYRKQCLRSPRKSIYSNNFLSMLMTFPLDTLFWNSCFKDIELRMQRPAIGKIHMCIVHTCRHSKKCIDR